MPSPWRVTKATPDFSDGHGWAKVANQGALFTVTGYEPRKAFYGTLGQAVLAQRDLAMNQLLGGAIFQCAPSTFGLPSGTQGSCYVQGAVEQRHPAADDDQLSVRQPVSGSQRRQREHGGLHCPGFEQFLHPRGGRVDVAPHDVFGNSAQARRRRTRALNERAALGLDRHIAWV